MALLNLLKRQEIDSSAPVIRKLEDDFYAVAVEIPLDDDHEDAICELLFTEDEVKEMYDVLFN